MIAARAAGMVELLLLHVLGFWAWSGEVQSVV
jgi:hypothetical protein